MDLVLATDLGGTNLRMAAVKRDGRILSRARRETPRNGNGADILQAIVAATVECRDNCPEKVSSVSVAVPATVSADGIIFKAPNLPALNGLNIKSALKEMLDVSVCVENDANAAAIGENWLGASQGFKNSICVTLGTGVGGGIIIDGKILRGADGTAGEIGHLCVEPFGVKCGCGSRGCLEQYSSATAIVRLTKDLSGKFPDSDLRLKANLTADDVYEAGTGGDPLALEVFRQMGFYLGIACAGLINILNTEIFVFGGGAAAGWDLFMPHVEKEVRERAYREPAARARFVRATLGDDAGIIGAAKIAFDDLDK